CFGAQSLNVFRGGSLVQDIPSLVANAVAHDTDDAADTPAEPARHLIRASQDSLIATLAGKTEIEVNSYHHQSVKKPGRDLVAAACASDGVIEAVEDRNRRFVVGVQWHPERGFENDALSQALFKSFISAAML